MPDPQDDAPRRTITSKEELNRAPPADGIRCASPCSSDVEGDKLLRCGTCKNQFYCSAKCQKQDWNAHKHNCSRLPLGELAYLQPLDAEQAAKLDEEVHRAALLLQDWEKAFDAQGSTARADGKPFRASELPENRLLLDLELAPEYSSATYKRLPPGHQTHPYRTPIVLLTRLFLIHLVSPSPSRDLAAVDAFQRDIGGWAMPTGPYAQLWAPKFACRPGDLSPGEYDWFSRIAHTHNVSEWFQPPSNEGEDTTPKDLKSPGDVAFARRLVNFAIAANSLWDVKDAA